MYTNKQYNTSVEQISQQAKGKKTQQFQLVDNRESAMVQEKLIQKLQQGQKKVSQRSSVVQKSQRKKIATSEVHIPIQRMIFYESEIPGNESNINKIKTIIDQFDTSSFQTPNTHLYICLYAANDGNNGTTELKAGTPSTHLTDLSDNLPINADLTVEIRINTQKIQGDLTATVFHEIIAHSIKENLMHISAIRKGIPYNSPEDIEEREHFIYGIDAERYLQNLILKMTDLKRIKKDIARYKIPLNQSTLGLKMALDILEKLLDHPSVVVVKRLDQEEESCPPSKEILHIVNIKDKLMSNSYTWFNEFWNDLEASFQDWLIYFSNNNALFHIKIVQFLQNEAHKYKEKIFYNT